VLLYLPITSASFFNPLAIMKSLAAASALLGVASAGIYRMPLQKVPLEDQFNAANIGHHMNALKQKYSQKYMGGPTEDIFTEQSMKGDPHDVPVENFLNAQCTKHRITSHQCG
jgi:saccharopepsin